MLSKAVVSTPAGERLYVTLHGEHGVYVVRMDAGLAERLAEDLAEAALVVRSREGLTPA